MLRGFVESYLDSLSEREFDGPLLAMLSNRGYTDIHFTHGGFEFGKDVIAKRIDPVTGVMQQLAIQSKAGDIGQGDWRAVRPQLDECGYNTRAHPGFDPSLPRVAVLVTTGRLKGAATVDAQEYGDSASQRGQAAFEVWDRETFAGWMCDDPAVGLARTTPDGELMGMLANVASRNVTEASLERFTRRWMTCPVASAAIEAALVCSHLRRSGRTDLAALVTLHLGRAALSQSLNPAAVSLYASSIRTFLGYAERLLAEVEPLLVDPADFARPFISLANEAAYSATCLRLGEILAPTATTSGETELGIRAHSALALLVTHPGSVRPPSDAFAASVLVMATALSGRDPVLARQFVRKVARWVVDRYDPKVGRLGLASVDEDEERATERILGGALSTTTLSGRRESYLATVLMDLQWCFGDEVGYEATRENLAALRLSPTITRAHEAESRWSRGGPGVFPQPALHYDKWGGQAPAHHSWHCETSPSDALAMAVVCRSRHYPALLPGVESAKFEREAPVVSETPTPATGVPGSVRH